MPIFSNRSIARMLEGIEPALGSMRAHDLQSRLRKGGANAVAAEWEIAAIYCLSLEGKVRASRFRDRVGNVDLIYSSHSKPGRVAVEITAISDESLHERNPVDVFNQEIDRLIRKYQVHRHGGIHANIGDVKSAQGPVLGVPAIRDLAAFFSSRDIHEFFKQIRTMPSERREYRFEARGSTSTLVYQPGRKISGSSHLSHTVLIDSNRNPVTTRLKVKDRQLRNSNLKLPGVVVFCDADCRALSTQMHSPKSVKVEDVVDLFLAGRAHIEQGPWLIQKGTKARSRRVNAVVLWSLHEAWNSHVRGPEARSVKAKVIPNRGYTYHTVHPDTVLEIAGAARHLPPIVTMPANALRKYKRPPFYGGWSTTNGGTHALAIKLSLLGVQQVLSGELEFSKFAADHAEAMSIIKRVTAEGAMLSEIHIDHVPDRDDDWIELIFDRVHPDQLFTNDSDQTWWTLATAWVKSFIRR